LRFERYGSHVERWPIPEGARDGSRSFQVWAFTGSHSQLLLRSSKDEAQFTRIDLLFKGVGRLCLPTLLRSLEVSEPDDGDQPRRFALKFEGGDGYVIADALFGAEDEGEYHEPSSLPFVLGPTGAQPA
jgi:hypothetical protein